MTISPVKYHSYIVIGYINVKSQKHNLSIYDFARQLSFDQSKRTLRYLVKKRKHKKQKVIWNGEYTWVTSLLSESGGIYNFIKDLDNVYHYFTHELGAYLPENLVKIGTDNWNKPVYLFREHYQEIATKGQMEFSFVEEGLIYRNIWSTS